MLVPKRVKHRREFRGKMRGEAKGGKEVSFGEYGLQVTTSHWITNRQIEAARIAMTRYMKRGGKVWIKIFPHKSYTAKAQEQVDLHSCHHWRKHPAGRRNHHPCHHGDHGHRRTREHQSPPASHSHHPCHHHHHLLRAAFWYREHRQIVWSLHAAMVPAAGCGGSIQHHVLPIDTEGFQPLLRSHTAGKIS